MKTDFLIIGGGVAGLAALNRLCEKGADVTLIEEGNYPSHKICGEFLSPEALPLLEEWQIVPKVYIDEILFVTGKNTFSMPLPQKAASIPRFILDASLAERARAKGACILTNAKVEHIEKGRPHAVTLASGDKWEASTLLISAGRLLGKLANQRPPVFRYIGAKAHFSGINPSNKLIMHLMKGAYFGIAPFSENDANAAGIIACSNKNALSPKETLQAFFKRQDSKALLEMLSTGQCSFSDWLVQPVPEFGIRSRPSLENTYFLGDAAGVIPPATGNGLSMALSSGIMAADFALQGASRAYQEEWQRLFGPRIKRGKLLNALFLRPFLVNAIPLLSRFFPSIPRYFYRMTRN